MPPKSTSKAPSAGEGANAASQFSRFAELVKTLQFAWFAGHATVLVSSILYFLSISGSSTFHQVLYSVLYLGVLESFGIIVYQHHVYTNSASSRSSKRSSIREFLEDENFLYCLLAVLWLLTPRFVLTIPPFFIFSVFHALTYIKSVLLPVVFQKDDRSSSVQFLTRFLRENHNKSLSWSCTSELVCLLAVILRAITWRRRSWIVLALYSLFIKARYERSTNMKTVIRKWEVRVDGLMSHPNIPPAVKQLYASSKMHLNKLGNYSLTSKSNPANASRSGSENNNLSSKRD